MQMHAICCDVLLDHLILNLSFQTCDHVFKQTTEIFQHLTVSLASSQHKQRSKIHCTNHTRSREQPMSPWNQSCWNAEPSCYFSCCGLETFVFTNQAPCRFFWLAICRTLCPQPSPLPPSSSGPSPDTKLSLYKNILIPKKTRKIFFSFLLPTHNPWTPSSLLSIFQYQHYICNLKSIYMQPHACCTSNLPLPLRFPAIWSSTGVKCLNFV